MTIFSDNSGIVKSNNNLTEVNIMKSFRLLLVIALAFSLILLSCTKKSTEPNENQPFPEDVTPFTNPEMAASVAESSVDGMLDFLYDANQYKTLSLDKPTTPQDSIYYENGWWYVQGVYNWYGDTFNLDLNYLYKIQFKNNGQVQPSGLGADEMHIIMDLVGQSLVDQPNYYYKMDMGYNFDLIYTNINSDPLIVNGEGNYDYDVEATYNSSTQKMRYYLKYTIENLELPIEGYPSGVITVESNPYQIIVTFDGTNVANVVIKDGNQIVYTHSFTFTV